MAKTLKFLVKTFRPPSIIEWKRSWKGILVGGTFALILATGSFDGDHSLAWNAIEALFAYVITFLSVIGDRIAASEREK